MLGAIRNEISSDDRYSSSYSKTHRAAMGFPFRSTGCVQRAKERWNESHTINGSAAAAKTKEKRGGVNRRLGTFPTKHCATPAKPFSSPSEALRKRRPAINGLRQTTRFGHVGIHPQLHLPRSSQDLPVRNAQVRSRLMDRQARDRDPAAPQQA
jgi:hypothetical protein